LETEVGLVLSELYHKKILTLEQIIYKLSINPRKILNVPVPKFEAGKAADFTIFDADEVWTADIHNFKSKSINTPFDKRIMNGKAIGVINNKKMHYLNELFEI
jgi:dihydroorotase